MTADIRRITPPITPELYPTFAYGIPKIDEAGQQTDQFDAVFPAHQVGLAHELAAKNGVNVITAIYNGRHVNPDGTETAEYRVLGGPKHSA